MIKIGVTMALENVTVVVTNYNKGHLLLRAIESVIEQAKIEDEIIIIDDASSSKEDHEILFFLQEDVKYSNIKVLINHDNLGVSSSKNRGVAEAVNDIIILLDGDDTLPSDALKTIKGEFCSRELDVLFGDYLHLVAESRKETSCRSIAQDGMINLNALAKNWLLLGTSPFRKSSCFETFKFNSNFNRTDDVDFHRQLILSEKKIGYVNKVIYNWHHFEGGNNDNIPNDEILYSHATGLKFFMDNLYGLDLLLFSIKFWVRFIALSIKR
ncbi:MAG: glycosyltransferase involved in cell wall biosynthesis [Francisellaceae bacterium]|jgi:glycosyltransferase involved in cell wall biosynthesis